MGFHLISIDEDQLRAPVADKEEFLSTLGSAVLLACMQPEGDTVSVRPPDPETNEPHGDPIITVRHVAEVDEDEIILWVWESREGVAIADLTAAELEMLGKIVEARKRMIRKSK